MRYVHVWYSITLGATTCLITDRSAYRVHEDPSMASLNRLHRVVTKYMAIARGVTRPIVIGNVVGWVWTEKKTRW